MRERQKLDSSIGSVSQVTNELTDATELIEMAEAENDAAMVADAENSVLALAQARRADAAGIHAVGRGRRQ